MARVNRRYGQMGQDPFQPVSRPTPPEGGEEQLPQYSELGPVPRRNVSPHRRSIYPTKTEKSIRMRGKLSPEEYIRKKTFERPGYFAIDRPLQSGAPFPQSMQVGAGVGTAQTGIIEVTAEADFEAVKVMSRAYLDDEQNSYPINTRYLILLKETASGRDLMNQPIHVENLAGDSELPLILPVTLFINRASVVSVQITNLNAEAIYVYFTLLGIKYYYRDALNLTGSDVVEDVEYKRL